MLAEILPSMFQRRVLLLCGLLAAAAAVPAIQLVRLTSFKGEELRAEAESRLIQREWIATTRGKILDRKGRVLALPAPSYDIAVDYPVITGQWAWSRAAREARRSAGTRWTELNRLEREQLIQSHVATFQAQLDAGWARFAAVAGVPAAEIESRRDQIKQQVQRAATTFATARRLEREAAAARSRELFAEPPRHSDDRIREQTQPHIILRGVPDSVAFRFKAWEDSASSGDSPDGPVLPGVRIVDSGARAYPLESVPVLINLATFPAPLRRDDAVRVDVQGVATKVIGAMRPRVQESDLAARGQTAVGKPSTRPDGSIDRGFYDADDPVGASGIEASAEQTLRGLRGFRESRTDTGEESLIAPAPGQDVQLTLDALLQARIQALFDPALGLTVVQPWHKNHYVTVGTPLYGAAVVLDLERSDILALVATPDFTRAKLAQDAASIATDELAGGLVNRAIAKPYPPGSIVKPLLFAEAVTRGVFAPDQTVDCRGHLLPDQPNRLQCWIWKDPALRTTHNDVLGHGLSGADAIMVSCNIFFYTLGRAMGPARMIDAYADFGIGAPASDGPPTPLRAALGLGPMHFGQAGDSKGPSHTSPGEAILMGIGQGPVTWTPLLAADAYATLARSGKRILPRLRADAPAATSDLRLDPTAVAIALEGLRAAVQDSRGTAHHLSFTDDFGVASREPTFNAEGVTVWGKSGTADAPAILAFELDEDGKRVVERDAQGRPVRLRDGDHSWFVCLVGPRGGAPKFAIAVVVDYGGSGGRVAAPIANQIIHALIAEGYL